VSERLQRALAKLRAAERRLARARKLARRDPARIAAEREAERARKRSEAVWAEAEDDPREIRTTNTFRSLAEWRAAQPGGAEPWAPAPDTDAMADAIRARWEAGPEPGQGGSRR
jgi:hypothetical protein